jgi:hypothetical protein
MAKKNSGKPQENQNSPAAASAQSSSGTANGTGTNGTANGMANGNGRTEQRANVGEGGASREMMLSNEEIAERAYQIYEREGRTDGRAMDHWLQAETELRAEHQSRPGSPASAAASSGPQSRQDLPRSARRLQESAGAGP